MREIIKWMRAGGETDGDASRKQVRSRNGSSRDHNGPRAATHLAILLVLKVPGACRRRSKVRCRGSLNLQVKTILFDRGDVISSRMSEGTKWECASDCHFVRRLSE